MRKNGFKAVVRYDGVAVHDRSQFHIERLPKYVFQNVFVHSDT